MSIRDFLKSGLLDNAGSIPLLDMILVLALAFALGLLIFFVYKRSYAGVMYSASFGVTLIALCMITAALILAVTSNVVLSLGMVGALSIVRFRTAIKEPSDIAFLFWSIAAGIILAAGFVPLAVFGSLVIALVLLIFARPRGVEMPYILVVRCSHGEAEAQLAQLLQEHSRRCLLKSKQISPAGIELNYELRLKGEETAFLNSLAALPGVTDTALVSYNGDYMS